MVLTALRNLLAHKIRLFTTGLAVMLGVAFIAGTLVLTDTLNKTFDDLFADALEGTDAMVRAEASFEDPSGFGDLRARIDASLLDQVQAVDGVALAVGDTWGFAQVIDTDGEPVGNPGAGPPTIGTNWPEGELNTWTLVAGDPPGSDRDVVLDKGVADDAGYTVGDQATVVVQGAPIKVNVSGIARIGGADSPGGATFVMFTTESAQRYVGEEGRFDDISVAAEDGVSQEEIVERIAEVVPSGVEVVTGATVTDENQDAMREGLSFFSWFMRIFAGVSLLVGAFIIFNTFFITVAQRTRENALLRAIGATRRQVLTAVLLEALGIGLIASALGLAVGIPLAIGLKALLAGFGFDIPTGSVVLASSSALVAFASGVVVTVLAAVSPSRKAAKVPPVAAMRDVAVGSTGYGSRQRIFVGTGMLALGAAALFYGLFGDPASAFLIILFGVLLVLFGVSALGRTVALPLSRVIGLPLPALRGISGHLARENAMRNPKRTATTASALMIGVGLVTLFTIFASSTKASFGNTLDEAFTGDFIASSGTGGVGGVSPEFTEQVSDLPEVETAGGVRAGLAEIDGDSELLLGVSPEAFDIFDVDPVAGSPADLDATSIGVLASAAEDKGLGIGDTVPVDFTATGTQEMTIQLLLDRTPDPENEWLVSTEAFAANYPDQMDVRVLISKAEGVTANEALAAVEAVADDYPGVDVLDQTEYKEEQMGVVDQLLGLVYALLGLAIIIALLGIGNTLALSIIERTRELGVLRAVGMTRAQLRSIIRWESVIIAVQGTLLGLVIGLFFGWALVSALHDEGLTTFSVPIGTLAVVVVLAALAGVVAAVLPARRAARLDVLRALSAE
jgi:putative ABC transport system permease protein